MSKSKTKPKEVQRNTNTNKKTKRLNQTKQPPKEKMTEYA